MSMDHKADQVLRALAKLDTKYHVQYALVLLPEGQDPVVRCSTQLSGLADNIGKTVVSDFLGQCDDTSLGGPDEEDSQYTLLNLLEDEAIDRFVWDAFSYLQQTACKTIAKAWVRAIEPRKQTNYPYKRGTKSKPPWWPHKVRHKEPDHLMKQERLHLLLVLLRSPDISVDKLRAATADCARVLSPLRHRVLLDVYRVEGYRRTLRASGNKDGPAQIRVSNLAAIDRSIHHGETRLDASQLEHAASPHAIEPVGPVLLPPGGHVTYHMMPDTFGLAQTPVKSDQGAKGERPARRMLLTPVGNASSSPVSLHSESATSASASASVSSCNMSSSMSSSLGNASSSLSASSLYDQTAVELSFLTWSSPSFRKTYDTSSGSPYELGPLLARPRSPHRSSPCVSSKLEVIN